MNIYEPQSFEEEKIRSKKLMKKLSIALVIAFLLTICIIVYIMYLQKKQLKVYIDNVKVKIPSGMIVFDANNTVYVSLSDIASKIGYEINKGEYKSQYVEDDEKCYLKNQYEAVSYIKDSDEIYKTILPSKEKTDIEHEYYTIDKPVLSYDNKLYITLDGLGQGCNLSCSYNAENNKIQIYTLDYLSNYYTSKIVESKESAEKDDAINAYKNRKAILYDMIVIKGEDERYGVNSLKNENIIGKKYKSIVFSEVSQEFIVETEDGKFGIIDKTGKFKITPEYSSIKQIDTEKGLYLVSKNSDATAGRTQYGIINKNNRIVVYIEYEQIGINKSDFPTDEIENPYLLYGKCIPVKKSNKWGLLDINGNAILPLEYDSLGCKSNTSTNTQANSLLLVPDYEAVVVCKNKMYGLYNSSGRRLIESLCTDMYGINSSGESKYYLTYQGTTMDIINYLKNLGIEPIAESSKQESNTNKEQNNNSNQNVDSNQNGNNLQNTNNQ